MQSTFFAHKQLQFTSSFVFCTYWRWALLSSYTRAVQKVRAKVLMIIYFAITGMYMYIKFTINTKSLFHIASIVYQAFLCSMASRWNAPLKKSVGFLAIASSKDYFNSPMSLNRLPFSCHLIWGKDENRIGINLGCTEVR